MIWRKKEIETERCPLGKNLNSSDKFVEHAFLDLSIGCDIRLRPIWKSCKLCNYANVAPFSFPYQFT